MIEREGHLVFNPAYLPFLESSSRDSWQKPEQVLGALALLDGSVVADIGAGGGYFTERFSHHLTSSGRVYATDVQEKMIERLHERVERRGLRNVRVVRGDFEDPGLPETCCDLVFFSSVYKEIDGRIAYMRKVRKLLRPGGRVAILEFRSEAPGAGPPAAVRLAPKQVISELAQAGFVLLETHDFLPRQYFLVFGAARIMPSGSAVKTRSSVSVSPAAAAIEFDPAEILTSDWARLRGLGHSIACCAPVP